MLKPSRILIAFFGSLIYIAEVAADPCGMVPPITTGGTIPITRIGEQRTYVFFKNGVETFVIRPGFSGKVDEFGMLIPFPTPPALRKVADNVFEQITAAIDPPEVVVDLRPKILSRLALPASANADSEGLTYASKDEVRVLRKEAVGMYEIAVLEAGSAAALKRWMDDNGYQYPTGMDAVCDEYVESGWCFVAVKTKVGQKGGVDPQPGQRAVTTQLPDGSTFDGNVQAMGFRFKTDQLVVPMRLSAFNEGELRNIVYLLTDGPRRIRKIPEEYVVRQISGSQLKNNVTELLPLRIIGGDLKDISPRRMESIAKQRDPHPKNGVAKELFAADLRAVSIGQLALPQEEREKVLLRIGERLGLRGADIDKENAKALSDMNKETVAAALQDIESMTLTVVDGDFPRDVIADANLMFSEYTMPQGRNSAKDYDAKTKKPTIRRDGTLILGEWRLKTSRDKIPPSSYLGTTVALLPLSLLWFAGRRRHRKTLVALLAVVLLIPTDTLIAKEQVLPANTSEAIADLKDPKTAEDAIKVLLAEAERNRNAYNSTVSALAEVARGSDEVTQRGWAIVALGEIGGYDVDELLLSIHADEHQTMLVRTWAAAARVSMTRTSAGLIEKAQLIQKFPALGRPIGMRLVSQLNEDGNVSVKKLLQTTMQVPQLQKSIAPAILAKGADALVAAMTDASDQNVRRQAAGYLGTLAAQQDDSVPKAVVGAYVFDSSANDVPWKGGPLFVPGLNWDESDARSLAGNLIAWHLWCDRKGRSAEQRQIHNNLRSLALARAAGYESPGFREADTVSWLTAWGKARGKEAVRELLAQQGVLDTPKYANVLEGLKSSVQSVR